jgi:short-subunit dehydrogenase
MGSQRFMGKVAIITGSSRGIGKAIAMELARNGAYIVLNGRNRERLIETENEVRNMQTRVISVCCDVSTITGSQLLINETVNAYKRIDILINNAGVSMRGNVSELNPDVFKTIFESNVFSSVYPTIPALKHLRLSQGSIVFISSLAGIRGLPSLSAYCSAKMALRALAESIRIEEASFKIHIGLIYVGLTEIEKGKETVLANGSKMILEPRSGKGVYTMESVAKAVIKNISKRKFVTILTTIGKLNAFMQAYFPMLVEWIILHNLKKFVDRSK